jgi:hypothetical protein
MKLLLVFRGDYKQVDNPDFVCENIKKQIIRPLEQQDSSADIIFCTYNHDMPKLDAYISALNPMGILYTNNGQVPNFKEALWFVSDVHNDYDYIIFLRFDIIYKKSIRYWNVFKKEGLIMTFKEDSEQFFIRNSLYGDVIIIISKQSYTPIMKSLIGTHDSHYVPLTCLHNIYTIVKYFHPEISIHTIVDGYYQSKTSLPAGDVRLNPLYIQVKYEYHGADRDQWL